MAYDSLPSSSHRLPSLARQRSTCRCHRAGSRPLPGSVRPCLPSSSLPPPQTAAEAPVRSLPSAVAHAVPLPPSPSLQPPLSSAATIIVATKPSLPPPPPPNLVLFGRSTFSRTEESSHQEVKSKRVLNLFMAQLLRNRFLFQDFQRVQI